MNPKFERRWKPWVPPGVATLAIVTLLIWLRMGPSLESTLRVPGTDRAPADASGVGATNPVMIGTLTRSDGQPAALPGLWPGFRGPNRNGILSESSRLARSWDTAGPRVIWSVDLGEGYAGPAVAEGRVYVMDYDQEKREDALRCLSLGDGREIWRFHYPVAVKRNHGMSRTVPTVSQNLVVAMGPKCHVVCLDATSGERQWGLDLVRQFGATVPPWYAGQCPLVEGDRVILAPGGPEALMVAVDLHSGEVLWNTPNPKGWKMTHSSIVPMDVAGVRMYLYCGSAGLVGVAARDGSILWDTTEWKISIATIPSPVPLEDGLVFLSGGYDAGSLMLRVRKEGETFTSKTEFKLEPDVFGATQQTPIYYRGHLFGVRPDGQLVCLDRQGQVVWASGTDLRFGMGPFLIADDAILAMNDSGRLNLVEASAAAFKPLAEAKVLEGRESWGPMALAEGRLLARDLTRMVCLEIGERPGVSASVGVDVRSLNLLGDERGSDFGGERRLETRDLVSYGEK